MLYLGLKMRDKQQIHVDKLIFVSIKRRRKIGTLIHEALCKVLSIYVLI